MPTLRREDLDQMTQPALCALYRELGYLGGKHPVETWHRDEIIGCILAIQQPTSVPAGCDTCQQPGDSCGFAAISSRYLPCVGCDSPTAVRSLCGAARTAQCPGRAPVAVSEPVAVRRPRPVRTKRVSGRQAEQREATEQAIAGLTSGESLRLLSALEGPFAPLRTASETGRRSLPFWRPNLPGITWAVAVVSGYTWKRPYVGRVCVLDRSGAWVAAASSVVVAHGGLVRTGEIEFDGAPGYYQVNIYPWRETDMPHPLGHVRKGDTTVWISAPRVALLRDLVHQSRWPDVDVLDSYTGDGCRLSDWTGHVNALRRHSIGTFGRESDQYREVKENFGQAMSLMLGKLEGHRRVWTCKAARPDWTHHIQDQASATLWRWADDCRQVTPDLPPVMMRRVDELLIPADAVEALTTRSRPGGRKPLVIDPTGIALGTFKAKEFEVWT